MTKLLCRINERSNEEGNRPQLTGLCRYAMSTESSIASVEAQIQQRWTDRRIDATATQERRVQQLSNELERHLRIDERQTRMITTIRVSSHPSAHRRNCQCCPSTRRTATNISVSHRSKMKTTDIGVSLRSPQIQRSDFKVAPEVTAIISAS